MKIAKLFLMRGDKCEITMDIRWESIFTRITKNKISNWGHTNQSSPCWT